ncbi:MAG: phosphatidate cytidylyltransferase [Candidatus Tectomicrobia bacterium]|uniref:Phosphatidate cytidylyltransferase n=1 Tax=Tectimicrobiota bacterium TaxID=2528274 RepID=A0A938B5D8_UNCTE|nr:phosphatidate cytidylyltransferase [Candidatus Tectomicrobia bacterium]
MGLIVLLVLLVLLLASVLVAILRRVRPHQDLTELVARVKSWWCMASLFFAIILANNTIALACFAFLTFWALKEYVTLLHTRPADHRSLLLAFCAIPMQYYWIGIDWYGMAIIFIPVYMFLILPAQLVLAQDTQGFVASASQMQWGLMAFVFGLSHLGLLLTLPLTAPVTVHGRTLLLFLVFVVEISDVLQYVWGKTLGRRKILPLVSPNKTWEGFIGGIASAVLCSLLMRFLTPFRIGETLLVALLITVAGFAGGAVMSAVKRDFGVKDFGQLIPGHGGMLDRVDSLCYAAPLFFHYVRYFYT